MSIKIFTSLDSMLQNIDRHAYDAEFVSIDIFDTLFIRRPHDPDQVKVPVAAYTADVARRYGLEVSCQKMLQVRKKFEREHRRRNRQANGDEEAALEDFMSDALQSVFGEHCTPELVAEIINYEIDVEDTVIVARPQLVAWIKRVAQAKKQVVLLTDMYLSSKLLRRLVKMKGLEQSISGIVSSADTKVTKASGGAYEWLRTHHGFLPESWIHIGDNPISDGERASKIGLRAFVIRDRQERIRKSRTQSAYRSSLNRQLSAGQYVGQLMRPLQDDDLPSDPLYSYGHEMLGPLVSFFSLCLIEKCKSEGVQHIYFCAREGWLLHKCWKTLSKVLKMGCAPTTASYLYVSRLSLAKASAANGISELSVTASLLPASNQNFTDVCRVFGLSPDLLEHHLNAVGLTLVDSLKESSARTKLSRLLESEEFQVSVRYQAAPYASLFERYLEQERFYSFKKVAIVDIGWLGTIQHFLKEATAHRPDRPSLRGKLLGATRWMAYQDDKSSSYEGLVYDRKRFDASEILVADTKDVLEELLRAPHPSVVGYEAVNGKVLPAFRLFNDATGEAERKWDVRNESLRKGAQDAVSRFAAAAAITGCTSDELRPWLRTHLVRMLAFPRNSELNLARPKVHQDDFARNAEILRRPDAAEETIWNASPLKAWIPFVRRYFYRRQVERSRMDKQ